MSRAYRKNERYFTHYKGEYYNDYYKNRSMKIDLDLRDYDDVPFHRRDICSPARIFRIVMVGDGDNYGRGMGGKNKTLLHKIDRSRYRHALNRCIVRDDYDLIFDVKPAYDPYDWE